MPKHLNISYALLCIMVRPRKFRRINFMPDVTYFKPQGIGLRDLKQVDLTFDELECLRLSDLEKDSQLNAAQKMNVHQSTFQRTLSKARTKITNALINGLAIKINGGAYKMPRGDRTGPDGKGPKTGRGLGYCSGNDKPGYTSERPRQGLGRGLGRGFGRGYGNQVNNNSELEELKREKEAIEKRIQELEK